MIHNKARVTLGFLRQNLVSNLNSCSTKTFISLTKCTRHTLRYNVMIRCWCNRFVIVVLLTHPFKLILTTSKAKVSSVAPYSIEIRAEKCIHTCLIVWLIAWLAWVTIVLLLVWLLELSVCRFDGFVDCLDWFGLIVMLWTYTHCYTRLERFTRKHTLFGTLVTWLTYVWYALWHGHTYYAWFDIGTTCGHSLHVFTMHHILICQLVDYTFVYDYEMWLG